MDIAYSHLYGSYDVFRVCPRAFTHLHTCQYFKSCGSGAALAHLLYAVSFFLQDKCFPSTSAYVAFLATAYSVWKFCLDVCCSSLLSTDKRKPLDSVSYVVYDLSHSNFGFCCYTKASGRRCRCRYVHIAYKLCCGYPFPLMRSLDISS